MSDDIKLIAMVKTDQTGSVNSVAVSPTNTSTSAYTFGFGLKANINKGLLVTYLIDTGASLTSLSTKTAKLAGIHDCKPSTFRTASGTIASCIAMVAELTIGSFQMQNVAVAVMPDMEVDLLGMNVLSHFEMKQVDGVMHLSYR